MEPLLKYCKKDKQDSKTIPIKKPENKIVLLKFLKLIFTNDIRNKYSKIFAIP
jgi:hypothetical protein